jgi:hypothetical protein
MAISRTRRNLASVAAALYVINITLTRFLRRVSQESQGKSDVPVHARIDTSKTCGVGVRVCVRVCVACANASRHMSSVSSICHIPYSRVKSAL